MPLQEKIFTALKAQMTENGKKVTSISDRTLNAEALRLSKQITDEANIESGIVDAVVVLKEFEGNMGAVAAEAARLAKGAPTVVVPPVVPPVTPPVTPPADVEPEWAKKIRERFEAQEAKESQEKKAADGKVKLTEVAKILKEKGAVHEKVLANTLALHQFDEAMTATQIADQALPLYNKEYKEIFGDGSAPKFPSTMSGEGKKEQQAAAQKQLDKTREKLGLPKPKETATT